MANCSVLCKARETCIDYHKVPTEVKDMCKQFMLNRRQLNDIGSLFDSEIKKGLMAQTHADAKVKCFVTYVQNLPTGNETGKFLALDLGGTNFRVLIIELYNRQCTMKNKIYELPYEITVGTGEQLFDYIADCLIDFMKMNKLENTALPLGFTFSFPLRQEGLTAGYLEMWTKGFNASGVQNKNVAEFLQKSIAKKGINIDVMAILNDTTGTLMSCAWKNHETYVGVIIGTGSNACYYESVKNAEMFRGPSSGRNVIINTEWGAFGDDGILDKYRSKYDKVVDGDSINPGKQTFEKMISGMYLGELVRMILTDLIGKDIFLKNCKNYGKLATKGSLETKILSLAETDSDDPHDIYLHVREAFGLLDIHYCYLTDEDYQVFRYVCDIVTTRASELASTGIITLVKKMGRPKVTIAVDGSVYRLHPHFSKRMENRCKDLSEGAYDVKLMLSEDGSGRGAALVAAVAAQYQTGQTTLPPTFNCKCNKSKKV